MREPRAFRQHRGNVGVAGRQFLGHDARRERVSAGAAALLGQSEACAGPICEACVDLRQQQAAVALTSSRSALSATGLISRVTKSRTVSRISSCSELS